MPRNRVKPTWNRNPSDFRPKTPMPLLIAAAEKGNVAEVTRLIGVKANVNEKDSVRCPCPLAPPPPTPTRPGTPARAAPRQTMDFHPLVHGDPSRAWVIRLSAFTFATGRADGAPQGSREGSRRGGRAATGKWRRCARHRHRERLPAEWRTWRGVSVRSVVAAADTRACASPRDSWVSRHSSWQPRWGRCTEMRRMVIRMMMMIRVS